MPNPSRVIHVWTTHEVVETLYIDDIICLRHDTKLEDLTLVYNRQSPIELVIGGISEQDAEKLRGVIFGAEAGAKKPSSGNVGVYISGEGVTDGD